MTKVVQARQPVAPPPDGMRALRRTVQDLDKTLRQALERKPNQQLAQLVYQLKVVRSDLGAIETELRKNTEALTSMVDVIRSNTGVVGELAALMRRVPTARVMTDKELDDRIRVGMKELQRMGILPS